jgi:DNA-directed RNA polymerase specialized sigma24 family protein
VGSSTSTNPLLEAVSEVSVPFTARLLVSPRLEPGDASPPADLRDEIEDMLHSLPSEQRDALVLVEWLGLSSEEAGSVLGISPASVRGRIIEHVLFCEIG